MTEYERGFIDGIKSKVSAELTPTLINVSKTMLEMLKPVLSTALENALNDDNTTTDTDAQSVKRGEWDGYTCSECDECADYFISGDFYFDEKPNFCPNCGARMDGDTNE